MRAAVLDELQIPKKLVVHLRKWRAQSHRWESCRIVHEFQARRTALAQLDIPQLTILRPQILSIKCQKARTVQKFLRESPHKF